jgi:hypothetical protein
LLIKDPSTAVAFEKALSPLDRNERDEKKAQVMV